MAIYDYLKPANYDYVDLFAGAGGWSLAAQRLGLAGVGLELDKSACATRKAVGFDTYEGDLRSRLAYHNTEQGLIASPPCQTFSMAGKGAGRDEMEKVLTCIRSWRWEPREPFIDPRTALVLEPLRWIMNRVAINRPFQWIAMEQVPTCLPIWEAYAAVLDELDYFTAVGVLNAEQYGVPQTRRRAILMAHRDRNVFLPKPTHSRYYPRDPKKLDPDVLPWVSMADALGWTDDAEVLSNYNKGGMLGQKGIRSGDQPAATVTSKINRNKVFFGRPATTVNCDPRTSQPGRHDPNESGSQQRDAIRVTPQETGILQSFPARFPWQGTNTAQYQQAGNAIPPLMAQAILEALVDV